MKETSQSNCYDETLEEKYWQALEEIIHMKSILSRNDHREPEPIIGDIQEDPVYDHAIARLEKIYYEGKRKSDV